MFVPFDLNRILDILLGEPLLLSIQCLRPVRQHHLGPQGCGATGVWGHRGVGGAYALGHLHGAEYGHALPCLTHFHHVL